MKIDLSHTMDEILDQWDALDRAIKSLSCASPWQMSEAMSRLDIQRASMAEMIRDFALDAGGK